MAPPLLLAVAGLAHPRALGSSTATRWVGLHIMLLPVFPLLVVGLLVPIGWRPQRDAIGAATFVAWAAAFVYAAYYTGLDAVAGIAAGTAAQHGAASAVPSLFAIGDALGHTGAYSLATAALATSVALFLRHGPRVLPGSLLLLAACWSFTDSHIFWPRGVFTMVGFAVAFALLDWAAGPRPGSSRGPSGVPGG